MGRVHNAAFGFQMTDEVAGAGASVLRREFENAPPDHVWFFADIAKEVFSAMFSVEGSIRRISDDLTSFVPTDADVESLAVCLYAARDDSAFGEARRALTDRPGLREHYTRMARAAFDHAGYLPSIMAARQDAIDAYAHERRQLANEMATWQDRCGNLEAQLKMSPGQNDAWVAMGPDKALPIDSITRLIQVAHEVKDEDLLKSAVGAAKKLLGFSFTAADLA